jgi:hypothetical protein
MAVGEMSQAEFTTFLQESLGALARYSSPGAVHFVCMDFRHIGELLVAGQKESPNANEAPKNRGFSHLNSITSCNRKTVWRRVGDSNPR